MAATTADLGAEVITMSKEYYNKTWSEIFIINLIINYLQNINIDMELKNESDIIYGRTTDLEVGDN
jgi:hypothetical protein